MRYYSSIATAKTLSTGINNSATQITLSGLPEGLTSYPYTLVIDPDIATEEIVTVTSLSSGTTLNVTRGQDGSAATSHSAGAVVKHMVTARDLQEPQTHIDATTSVHGISNTSDLATKAGSETLTNKTIALGSNTVSGTTAQFNTALSDGDFATLAGAETLTNKTLTSAVENYAVLKSPQEVSTVSATSATGTINMDVLTSSILYYTTASSGNFSLNVRGNSTTTLNSLLAVNNAITVVLMVTNTAVPWYLTGISIDGTSIGPKWMGGTAPTSGNSGSVDTYSFTIVKTAATPTYTIFASVVKFA